MNVSEIDLYNIIKGKLGDPEAENLVKFIKAEIKEKVEDQSDRLASKADLADLKMELKVEIANTRADLIKWMFIFWVGQLAAIVAISKFLM